MQKKFLLTFIFILTICGCAICENKTESLVNVINMGRPGATSSYGLSKLKKNSLPKKTQHIVIYFGINDSCNSKHLVSVENYKKNIKEIISLSKKSGINNIVLVTPNPVIAKYLIQRHPTHPNKDNINAHVDKYANAIRELAKEKKVLLADFNKAVKKEGGATEAKESLLRNKANSKSKDGVHFTKEGYTLLANLVFKKLDGKVSKNDTIVCLGDSITFGVYMKGKGTATGETYPGQLAKIFENKLK